MLHTPTQTPITLILLPQTPIIYTQNVNANVTHNNTNTNNTHTSSTATNNTQQIHRQIEINQHIQIHQQIQIQYESVVGFLEGFNGSLAVLHHDTNTITSTNTNTNNNNTNTNGYTNTIQKSIWSCIRCQRLPSNASSQYKYNYINKYKYKYKY